MKEQQAKNIVKNLNDIIANHIPSNISFVLEKDKEGRYFAALDMSNQSPLVARKLYLITAVLLNNFREISGVCRIISNIILELKVEKIIDTALESLNEVRIDLMKTQLAKLDVEYEGNGIIRNNIALLSTLLKFYCGDSIRFIDQEIDGRLEFLTLKFKDNDFNHALKLKSFMKYLSSECEIKYTLGKEQLTISVGLLNKDGWHNAFALGEVMLEMAIEKEKLAAYLQTPFDSKISLSDANSMWLKELQGTNQQSKNDKLSFAEKVEKNKSKAIDIRHKPKDEISPISNGVVRHSSQETISVRDNLSEKSVKPVAIITKVPLGKPTSILKSSNNNNNPKGKVTRFQNQDHIERINSSESQRSM